MTESFELELSRVKDPLIEEVILCQSGQTMQAADMVAKTRRELALMRAEYEDAINRNDPIARCAACHRPVKPRLSRLRRQFFRHYQGDGNCPYKTTGERNQRIIDAMRYNGRKEGDEHKRVKKLLESSIKADAQFDDLAIEQRWWGITDETKWRKPDVKAKHNGVSVAFEVQLSTTFLNVMRERRQFYLENGGILLWIFKSADTVEPRQFQDDAFYCNNSNLFVVDDETCQISVANGRLMLRCHYQVPCDGGDDVWRTEIVSFDKLTIDLSGQRVFYFDYEAAMEELRESHRQTYVADLRGRFTRFMANYQSRWESSESRDREYQVLRKDFLKQGIALPDEIKRDFLRFSILVLSARKGEPVGTGHPTLLQVANYAYDKCRNLLWYFLTTLSLSGTLPRLLEEDNHAKQRKNRRSLSHIGWEEKLTEIRTGIRQWRHEQSGGFPEDRSFDDLFFFLFPDIEAALSGKNG